MNSSYCSGYLIKVRRWLVLLFSSGAGLFVLTTYAQEVSFPEQLNLDTLKERKSECFFVNTVDDWRAVDKNHLLVWAPGRQAFLVELFPSCDQLFFAETIAFKSRHNHFCGYAGDAVLVRDQSCHIGKIIRLTEAETQWLKEYRRKRQTNPKGNQNSDKK